MTIKWRRSPSHVSRMLRLMCSSISMLICCMYTQNVLRKCVNCQEGTWQYHIQFFQIFIRPATFPYSEHSSYFKSLFNQMFTCCRKSNEEALKERRRVSVLCNMMEPSLLQFYISRQWLNKFKTFAEPGPISNTDFLCPHGGMSTVIIKRFYFQLANDR